MTRFSLVVPFKQLPPGYARSLGPPPDPPVRPKPAATLALLREGRAGLEVLLLKRGNRTRFIPGAFVFPGGRVDEEDASPDLHALMENLSPGEADTRLGISGSHPPGLAYWAAAFRETFEETGILLGAAGGGYRSVPMEPGTANGRLRISLHRGEMSFRAVLEAMGTTVGGGRAAYIGHWVTPVQERYRYDTRFFGTEIPAECPVHPDGTELVQALWITPAEASIRNREGSLPMVFPTIKTLEALEPFPTPREALDALGKMKIPRLLPRVEETRDGIRMVLEGRQAV